MLTHKQLRTKALANAEVKAEYEKLADEFSLLDEFLKARAAQGLTQAQVAEKIGRNDPCPFYRLIQWFPSLFLLIMSRRPLKLP